MILSDVYHHCLHPKKWQTFVVQVIFSGYYNFHVAYMHGGLEMGRFSQECIPCPKLDKEPNWGTSSVSNTTKISIACVPGALCACSTHKCALWGQAF